MIKVIDCIAKQHFMPNMTAVSLLNQPIANEKKPSYTVLAVVVLLHALCLTWLMHVQTNVPVLEKEQAPMMVSLLSNATLEQTQSTEFKVIKKQNNVVEKKVKTVAVTKLNSLEEAILAPTRVETATPSLTNKAFATEQQEKENNIQQKDSKDVGDKELNASTAIEQEPVIEPPSFGAAYLENPAPDYPRLSRRAGEEGRVILKVLVSSSGATKEVMIEQTSSYDRLDEAALAAVKKWRFIPAKKNNQAISAYVLVPIKFDLDS